MDRICSEHNVEKVYSKETKEWYCEKCYEEENYGMVIRI